METLTSSKSSSSSSSSTVVENVKESDSLKTSESDSEEDEHDDELIKNDPGIKLVIMKPAYNLRFTKFERDVNELAGKMRS